jgi:hypothetical protein
MGWPRGVFLDFFAGIPVAEYQTARVWCERLLGGPPSFVATPTEAVWELALHRAVYVVERPERAGLALLGRSSHGRVVGAGAVCAIGR